MNDTTAEFLITKTKTKCDMLRKLERLSDIGFESSWAEVEGEFYIWSTVPNDEY